jgi:LAO/AO transport system kinase
MIESSPEKYAGGRWKPPILKIEAIHDKGVKEFLAEVERHRNYLMHKGICLGLRKNKEKIREELEDMLRHQVFEEVIDRIAASKDFSNAVDAVERRETDPYSAADNLALSILRNIDHRT